MIKKWLKKNRKGMTPTELLIAIIIIGITLLLIVVLIEKSLSLKKTEDINRFNDVQLILSSILLYEIDTHGDIPPEIDDDSDTWQMIGILGSVCTDICSNRVVESECIYLEELTPKYLEFLPQDRGFTKYGPTGYYINKKKGTNIVTVGACTTEVSSSIEIKQ